MILVTSSVKVRDLLIQKKKIKKKSKSHTEEGIAEIVKLRRQKANVSAQWNHLKVLQQLNQVIVNHGRKNDCDQRSRNFLF